MNKLVLALFLVALPMLSTSINSNAIEIKHIQSVEQLRYFKMYEPEISDDVLEEGYRLLPAEEDFSSTFTRMLKNFPVWGTWLIFKNTHIVGRISLSIPTAENPRSEIYSWLKPGHRNGGIGTVARQKLYAHILPFVGKEGYVATVVNAEGDVIKCEYIVAFHGVLSRIGMDNYGSMISQLSAGADILTHDYYDGRVVMLHFAYPIPQLSREKLESDQILKRLKVEILPSLFLRTSRSAAIIELKALERGPQIPMQKNAQRGILRLPLRNFGNGQKEPVAN